MTNLWALKAVWSGDPHPDHPKELWWCRPRVWSCSKVDRLLHDGLPLGFLRSGVETRLNPNYVVRLVRIKRRPKPRVESKVVLRGTAIQGGDTGYALLVRPPGKCRTNSDGRVSSARDFTAISFATWVRANIGADVRVTLERLAPDVDEQNPPGFAADPPEVP